MRTYLLILFCLLAFQACDTPTPTSSEPIDDQLTTFLLVRHTEKDTTSKNPPLSEAGAARAAALGSMLKDVALDAVFSTDYLRTVQTAEAVTYYHPLDIQLYDPTRLETFTQNLQDNFRGKTVLISGHSNTTPALLNLLTGTSDYSTFPEFAYGELYLVSKGKSVASVTQLHFGD